MSQDSAAADGGDFLALLEALPPVETRTPVRRPQTRSPRRAGGRRRAPGSFRCEQCGGTGDIALTPTLVVAEKKVMDLCGHCRARELAFTKPACSVPGCEKPGGYFYYGGSRHCPDCLELMPSTCGYDHGPSQIPEDRKHVCLGTLLAVGG